MTNKEKLEIIDRQLDLWYKILEPETLDDRANVISQTIHNLESTKLLLEPLSNSPTIYECANCGKQIECYGEFINGECLNCGYGFVKKDVQ